MTGGEIDSIQAMRDFISHTNCSLRHRCLIVFTNGSAMKKTSNSLQDYIKGVMSSKSSSGKVLRTLMNQVGLDNCMSVENYTDDEKQKKNQRKEFYVKLSKMENFQKKPKRSWCTWSLRKVFLVAGVVGLLVIGGVSIVVVLVIILVPTVN